MAAEHTGGCLCGAVRYRATAEPLVVTHCHCTLCQKESGAAFVTWAAFPKDAFAFTEGAPAAYWATDKAERTFCSACGGTLTFVHVESAHQVDVAAGSLDKPGAVRPRDHIWDSSRIPWAHMADGLPRHRGERDE
ncbi:MAG: GFA family protein [Rhodospirillales bacterium]|jgi:hypothetical protein|nr:GFA family protein [Rhodospirillales bacterium]MDP6773621.1 GFA family protein [Rhodospirillales bacterium]